MKKNDGREGCEVMSLKKEVDVFLALKSKPRSWLANKLEINEGYLSRILNGRDEPKHQIERIKEYIEKN
ncbi:XRE family transcriptional regulator [Enterococcus casseliflavus]|uniref:XRE family transcriptional regulator n=1 Tax=Enterococcus casseliflavus TaxID=37734 RepID=UPI0023313F47|nr:XRE family transcriptional regulator [Enterococcus casseliflavus]MDB1690078.1 XRE family transcriptional regulator [Enterococcus casseliflavus]